MLITKNYQTLREMPNPPLVRLVRAVQVGVHWLHETALKLVEPRAIAATTSALVAAERNHHSVVIQRLVTDLSSRQRTNGSWNDELWDTTWAIRALLDAGTSLDALPIQRALRFIRATQDP